MGERTGIDSAYSRLSVVKDSFSVWARSADVKTHSGTLHLGLL